jgi:hypothetical protein
VSPLEEVDGSHLLSTAVNSGWDINMSIGKCNNKLFFDLNTALTSGPMAGLSVRRVAGLLNRASPVTQSGRRVHLHAPLAARLLRESDGTSSREIGSRMCHLTESGGLARLLPEQSWVVCPMKALS